MAVMSNPLAILKPALKEFSFGTWLVMIITFIYQLANMAQPFFLLYLTQHLAFSKSLASLLLLSYGIGAVVFSLVAGKLIECFNEQLLIIGIMMVTALALLGLLFFHEPLVIFFFSFLWGGIFNLYRVVTQSLLLTHANPKFKKIIISFYRLVLNLGASIAPLIASLLISIHYSLMFSVSIVISVVTCLVFYYYTDKSSLARRLPTQNMPARWRFPNNIWLFLLGIVFILFIFFQLNATLSLYVVQYLHLSYTFYALLFTVNTLLIVLFEVPLNAAMQGWSYKSSLMLGALLITIGFCGYGISGQHWLVILFTIIWSFGEMILFPSGAAYVSSIAPPAQHAHYLAFYSLTFNLGLLLGPPGGTLMYQHLGANSFWMVLGLMGVIGMGFLMFIRNDQSPSHRVSRE